ncbi:MAG: hypothetical protein Phog2KO_33150 [Phototrophicaceae bacterium]
MPSKHQSSQVFILLLTAFLSFFALENARRFHPDEAFYMTIARHGAINGDWLFLAEPMDKPPLTFYSNALALVFFAIEADDNNVLQLDPETGEFAGRMPSVLMSIVLVAVMMKLVSTVSKQEKLIYLAGILTALSPMRIVFAPTAFTDTPMLLLGTIALWMAFRGRWGWSGFWLILSISAKPQIIFYAPLILALLVIHTIKNKQTTTIPLRLFYFSLPILIGLGLLWGWDSLRVINGAESFYQLGQSRYTATSWTTLADYPTRVSALWQTNQYLFGHGVLTIFIVFIALIRLMLARKFSVHLLLLWGWLLSFFAIHLVLTLNLFDRNQIIVLPIVVLAIVTAINTRSWHAISLKIFSIILAYVMVIFALQASLWKMPIGGDDGRHDGIHILASYLNSKPVATVIYDTWLDWELDYYMGQWTDKRRVFYPTPELLVVDALALDEQGSRYFVAPNTINVSAWIVALEQAQFRVSLDIELENFTVYQVIPAD